MQLISIIVPVHNNRNTLQECVNSLLAQTYPKIEIILVSNGCSDGSLQLCEDLAAANEHIIHIAQTESGVSKARNTGLSAASGDFIGFVDADDYIEKDMYEKMVSALERNDAEVCVCGYITHIGEIVTDVCSAREYTVNGPGFLVSLFSDEYTEGFVCNKLYKKESLHECFFDEELIACEDLVFNAFVANRKNSNEKNFTATFIPCASYHYIKYESSATGSDKLFKSDTFIYYPAFTKLFDIFATDAVFPHICRKYYDILIYSRYTLVQELKKTSDALVRRKNTEALKKLRIVYKHAFPYVKKAKLSKKQLLSFLLKSVLPVSTSHLM